MIGNLNIVVTYLSLQGVMSIGIDYFIYQLSADGIKLIGCIIIIIGTIITFLMSLLILKSNTKSEIEESLIKTQA